eukprot:1763359-Ditylum_brightwellii.AAC.2
MYSLISTVLDWQNSGSLMVKVAKSLVVAVMPTFPIAPVSMSGNRQEGYHCGNGGCKGGWKLWGEEHDQ